MKKSTMLIVLAAGAACAANAAQDTMEHADARSIPTSQIGSLNHVYYNIATGETIISNVEQGQTVAADTGSSELIWSVNMEFHQCEGINGHTGISAIGLGDDIDGTTPWAVGGTWSSMGDIASDTVVDCVGFNYWSAHQDIDLDSDGNADGVPGFGIVLDWWDADNGFSSNVSTRTPLIQLTFGTLPGGLDLAPDFFAGYQFTVDLTAESLGVDLTMEIGDSDGDTQGAAVSNGNNGDYPIGELGHDFDLDGNDDADIDGDGLFDWTMGMRFIQPGTFDFDGDEILDGDVAAQADTSIGMGAPAGHTLVQDDEGIWGWEIDLGAPAVATGAEMYTAIYLPPDPVTGDIIHSGFVASFAGFDDEGFPNPPSCDEGLGFIPTATIAHSLYTPVQVDPCPADLDGSGTLDFFDVSEFLDQFGSGADYNGDGVTDFFDVSDFLDAFGIGCP
tara:strand:- start:37453 stop:38793 length:1341 start_codon:yes stop_codon:yes gene_type:complete